MKKKHLTQQQKRRIDTQQEKIINNNELDTARVITRYNNKYLLLTQQNEQIEAISDKKIKKIITGDIVKYKKIEPDYKILARMSRHNELVRKDNYNKKKCIAVNVTQLILVTDVNQYDFLEIDKYFLASKILKTEFTIIINKIDLIDESQLKKLQKNLNSYKNLNIKILYISALDLKIKSISEILNNHTNILVGKSGVGKSSISQCILPKENIKIGEISLNGKGCHTTSISILYSIDKNTNIIDSPGRGHLDFNELCLKNINASFDDIIDISYHCKFRDCRHQHEKDCAVQKAIQENSFLRSRYISYNHFLNLL